MEKLKIADFELIESDLKQIIGAKINQTTIINSRAFLFSFSMIKKEKLFISLDHQKPLLSLVEANDSIPTITGILNDTFRKYLRDSYIVNVCLLNKDRIIEIKLQKPNDLFEKELFYLIIEFVPQRPNLLILNEQKQIIFAMHYSSALSSRTIVLNATYEAPENTILQQQNTNNSLSDLKTFAHQCFENSIQQRKEEKFEPLYKFIKIRLKSLEKKLKVLDGSIQEAKQKLAYQDHGNMILAYSQNIDEVIKYVKENNLKYDDTVSIGVNANYYFKIYKKSKRTIEMDKIELIKCHNDISYLQSILTSSHYMNEDEIIALYEEIMPHKFTQDPKHKKNIGIGIVENNNVKIYFGKNAKSNEKLTFSMSEKTDTFLHIKDYHGAHILIKSKSPSNDDLLFGAEIALLLSNKESGEVYYSLIKDVKKGDKPGLVNLLSYKTILINNIRESSKQKLSHYKNI